MWRRENFEFYAAGRQLYAERITPDGASAGPTLVFLHEGLGSIKQWGAFPRQLCQQCHLPGLIYDRWGFGRAEPLSERRQTDYLHSEAQISLPEVLRHCAVREPPILIGHSDGGSIALLFAAAFPDRVRAVITEAAHVFVEDVTLTGIREARDLYQNTDLRDRLVRYHGAEKVDSVFRGWCDTWLSSNFRNWDIQARLPHITCPLLVLQGDNDEYGTAEQVRAIAAGVSGPVETLLIPGCGHVPHHQAREQVLAAMPRFIADCCDGSQIGKTATLILAESTNNRL